MRLEAIVLGYRLRPGDWSLTMVCFVRGLDTEDNAAIADGHGSQWQQKAKGEVISSLLANEPLVVLIGPAWRTIWNRNSWSGVEDY